MTVAGESGAIAPKPGRVGPNAIIRVAEALRDHEGEIVERRLMRDARLDSYIEAMPTSMVDEHEVTRLQHAVLAGLGAERARLVLLDAGKRTGDYLLANRIPRAAQRLLRILPSALASRMLLSAIRRNAWTFSGSGQLLTHAGPPVRLSLSGCPLCHAAVSDTPICDYYAATFERLFRELVSSRAVCRETECRAAGAETCVFEVSW
jgi:divinyl protochlorophyllide a 8-vinyl-reductase